MEEVRIQGRLDLFGAGWWDVMGYLFWEFGLGAAGDEGTDPEVPGRAWQGGGEQRKQQEGQRE